MSIAIRSIDVGVDETTEIDYSFVQIVRKWSSNQCIEHTGDHGTVHVDTSTWNRDG